MFPLKLSLFYTSLCILFPELEILYARTLSTTQNDPHSQRNSLPRRLPEYNNFENEHDTTCYVVVFYPENSILKKRTYFITQRSLYIASANNHLFSLKS